MVDDEPALLRLWREKRGEVENIVRPVRPSAKGTPFAAVPDKINLSPEQLPYCINRYWPSLTSATLPCSISVSIARLNLRRRTV